MNGFTIVIKIYMLYFNKNQQCIYYHWMANRAKLEGKKSLTFQISSKIYFNLYIVSCEKWKLHLQYQSPKLEVSEQMFSY